MKEFEGSPCYAFFRVQSAGVLDFWKGFLPAEKSAVPPEEVTRLLELAPFRSHAAGDLRPDGKSRYNFSAWYGCGQAEPAVSRFDQCGRIVQALSPRIPALLEIQARYNVAFSIQIFPCDGNPDCSVIGFTREIIDFCHRTGTEIVVDLFLYGSGQ